MNITSISLSGISLSGMNAAQTRLEASAHNVANLNTAGFTRQEVSQSSTNGGGTFATVSTSASGPGNGLETDMVQQLQAKNVFLANLSVFKASNDMLGNLLDTTA